jgi:hypothetical protein
MLINWLCSFQPYRAKTENSQRSELQCVAADEFSLDSAILHSLERGVGLDSTWRHICQNFTPLTLVNTATEYNRMVPGEESLKWAHVYTDIVKYLLLYQRTLVLTHWQHFSSSCGKG